MRSGPDDYHEQLISILEEYEAAGVNSEELEQKTLFRLLNCCLPPEDLDAERGTSEYPYGTAG